MKIAIVATATIVDVSVLKETLNKLQYGDPSYYLLQCPDCITNWRDGSPTQAEIGNYTYGRLFGKDGEVRWQKTADGYSLLWLSERDQEDNLLKPFKAFGSEWEVSVSQKIYLLGGGETKPWRDTRIPRKLDYPMKWCKSPQVRVIQYKDLDSQTIRFTRYTEFVK